MVWVSASELSLAKTKKAKVNLKRSLYSEKVSLALKSGIQKNVKSDEFQGKNLYHRIFYVRYIDDCLIGIKGPKSFAFELQKRIFFFLKSGLYFSLKESGIVYALSGKVNFLGFHLKVPKRSERAVVETRKILSFKKIRNRITQRKKAIEDRYQKSLLATYDFILKSKLKRLGKGEKTDKDIKIKQLATSDALIFHEIACLKDKK